MNKTALITGASSGIGASFAREMAKDNWSIIIHGRREELLKKLSLDLVELGAREVKIILGDLRDKKVLESIISFGCNNNIDLLINNAGYGTGREFIEDTIENQMGMLEVHGMAVVSITKGILPLMIQRGSGKIINVSSIAGEQSLPKSVMYSSSKAFLTRFSESLGLEVRKKGVLVQALLPGFTHTDFHDKLPKWEREKRNKGFITWHSSDYVAKYSLKKINMKNPPIIVIPGFSNKVLAVFPKLIPKFIYYKIALSVTK